MEFYLPEFEETPAQNDFDKLTVRVDSSFLSHCAMRLLEDRLAEMVSSFSEGTLSI